MYMRKLSKDKLQEKRDKILNLPARIVPSTIKIFFMLCLVTSKLTKTIS